MTVIKQTNWLTPTGLPEPTVQQLGENPSPYRELLMAAGMDQEPIPYVVTVPTSSNVAIRVPHGMGTDAAVRVEGDLGNPNPVGAGHERIPDVVIPVPVFWASVTDALGNVTFDLLYDPLQLTLPPSTTGLWADESYVYLMARNTGSTAVATFVVYVEYTHSVIRNEIVVGEYYELGIR